MQVRKRTRLELFARSEEKTLGSSSAPPTPTLGWFPMYRSSHFHLPGSEISGTPFFFQVSSNVRVESGLQTTQHTSIHAHFREPKKQIKGLIFSRPVEHHLRNTARPSKTRDSHWGVWHFIEETHVSKVGAPKMVHGPKKLTPKMGLFLKSPLRQTTPIPTWRSLGSKGPMPGFINSGKLDTRTIENGKA